jgi:four helix bundle protein
MKNSRIYDLEDRFIKFAIATIDLSEKLPNTRLGNHLANQLIRSSTSPALDYGEAQGAESKKDFINCCRLSN